MMNDALPPDALIERMEALLQAWRPEHIAPVELPSSSDIPLLTDALRDDAMAQALPAAMPDGVPAEVMQAHLAAACEQVMHALYRELSTDLNQRVHLRMRQLVDEAVDLALRQALVGLRRQILMCVAQTLTSTVESLGRREPPSTE